MSFGLFNTRSTYQTDYLPHQVSPNRPWSPVKTDDVLNESVPKPLRQKDVSTMKYFQSDVYVPFDLFHRPKGCVTTNPFQEVTYKRKDKSNEFSERLESRRTRKRVYMIPQISLDDVDQDMMYKKNGLGDNIYTSDWKIATEFTKEFAKNSISNVPTNYKPRNVSFKAKEFCIPIEPGLQSYSKDWNRCQLRANSDPTNLFWTKNSELGKCSVCEPQTEQKLSRAEVEELEECLAKDSLRLPYQLKMPGYCGYVPEVPKNIKPKRNFFSRFEPWLSTTMEAQGVFKRLYRNCQKLSRAEVEELEECLAKDSLRLPYQLKMPGYCGYVPEVPKNIKPKRNFFSRVEPWLSTTMEAQGVFKRL